MVVFVRDDKGDNAGDDEGHEPHIVCNVIMVLWRWFENNNGSGHSNLSAPIGSPAPPTSLPQRLKQMFDDNVMLTMT